MKIAEANGSVRFAVRVQPRAPRTEIAGEHGDAMKVRLSAPPVDGAANDALVEFLARTFAVAKRDVKILAGETSRSKVIQIDGVTERAVRSAVAVMPR